MAKKQLWELTAHKQKDLCVCGTLLPAQPTSIWREDASSPHCRRRQEALLMKILLSI